MDILEKNGNLSKIVGNNIKHLRIQADLTIDGLAFALSISISYTLMIEKGSANISPKLVTKVANFFGVEVSQLYSSKIIILRSPIKIETVSRFYYENQKNAKFFLSRRGEYSVAAFLRNILLSDPYMIEGREVSDLIEYCYKNYQRKLSSQEMSRELRRLYNKGVVGRKDKFGNGSVFLYFIK